MHVLFPSYLEYFKMSYKFIVKWLGLRWIRMVIYVIKNLRERGKKVTTDTFTYIKRGT